MEKNHFRNDVKVQNPTERTTLWRSVLPKVTILHWSKVFFLYYMTGEFLKHTFVPLTYQHQMGPVGSGGLKALCMNALYCEHNVQRAISAIPRGAVRKARVL
jgi:hypothetical protein